MDVLVDPVVSEWSQVNPKHLTRRRRRILNGGRGFYKLAKAGAAYIRARLSETSFMLGIISIFSEGTGPLPSVGRPFRVAGVDGIQRSGDLVCGNRAHQRLKEGVILSHWHCAWGSCSKLHGTEEAAEECRRTKKSARILQPALRLRKIRREHDWSVAHFFHSDDAAGRRLTKAQVELLDLLEDVFEDADWDGDESDIVVWGMLVGERPPRAWFRPELALTLKGLHESAGGWFRKTPDGLVFQETAVWLRTYKD